MIRIESNDQTKLHTLKHCRYFDNVGDDILNEIWQGMFLQRFDRGEPVMWEGEDCKGLYIIDHGSVKLYKTSHQGRELVINVLGEGESFNEVPVFDGDKNPVNVATLEDSDIWLVDAESIRSCLYKYPEVTKAVILNLSKNLRMLVGKVEELSFYQVTNRLARLLDQLPEEQLLGKTDFRLTRDDIAGRLGTVREVVTRSLKELERSGAIQVSHRSIEITNKDRLREWAQIPCE
jgi:CRP/FNR family transcriptional regulator